MTIGLLILGVVALLVFFGVTQKTLKELGVPEWVAFVSVLALVMGVVIPSIQIGNVYLSISGFLLPLVACCLLFALIGMKKELLWVAIAVSGVATSVVILKLIMSPSSSFLSLQSILIGLVGGTISATVAKKRVTALLSSILGIIIGDVVMAIINYYAYHHLFISIGTDGSFDAIILASVWSLSLIAMMVNIRVAMVRRKITPNTNYQAVAQMEAAQDIAIEERKAKRIKKQSKLKKLKNKNITNDIVEIRGYGIVEHVGNIEDNVETADDIGDYRSEVSMDFYNNSVDFDEYELNQNDYDNFLLNNGCECNTAQSYQQAEAAQDIVQPLKDNLIDDRVIVPDYEYYHNHNYKKDSKKDECDDYED